MTTYNTGNPVPSTDARDRYDNSQTFDEVMNGSSLYYMNRTGSNILSMSGMAQFFYDAQADRAQKFEVMDAEFDTAQEWRQDAFNQLMINTQFEWPPIPFEEGSPLEVSRPSQLISREGQLYSVRLPANFPVVLSGVWDVAVTSLTPRSDEALRQQLAAPSGGGQVGILRQVISAQIKNMNNWISSRTISVNEFANLATGYSDTGDRLTWDWAPAINAASAVALTLGIGVVEFTAQRFNVQTPVRRYDGVSFKGMGALKSDTSAATSNDVTTIANLTNTETVMESQGKTSGTKNIIAHMAGIKVIGNTSTVTVLDLKGFWLSKFEDCFIGGGKTTVWGRSDIANGYNCYYCDFKGGIISGLNPNNFDNTPNTYGLRLTDFCQEFHMDGVNILNASNAFSVESSSYCHVGYVNIEYSSINHQPIFIDSPASVIQDLRCDPHRPMTRPFLRMGPNSRNNRVNLKTFESVRVGVPMSYYFSDDEGGLLNEIRAGVFYSDYTPKRNLIANPDFLPTSATVNYGWTKSSVTIDPDGYNNGKPVSKIVLTLAANLANATCLIEIPVASLGAGSIIALDIMLLVNSPSAMLGFSDANGLIAVDGSLSGQVLSVANTDGKFQRVRRIFALSSQPAGALRLSLYPSRSSTGSVTSTIGDYVRVCDLGVDVIDPYSTSKPGTINRDGTMPMLNDLFFRKPGSGPVLTTPDGGHTYRLSISNAGALIITQLT